MSRRVVIAGSLAQKPHRGGHAWVFLQYLLGFARLGWDVLFLDQIEPAMCTDERGEPCPVDQSANLRYFLSVLTPLAPEVSFALLCDGGARVIGASRRQVVDRVTRASLLLNVNGFLRDPEILDAAAHRVFLDIDPGVGHMWQALGLHHAFHGHHQYVTIGQNIGRLGSVVPTCGIDWITTRPPVVLAHWPLQPIDGGGCFTSVASWRGAFGPIDYQGKTYGLRVHEFRKFAALPRLSGHPFELALNIHPSETRDTALLTENGWVLRDPRVVAGDPAAYRAYIQGSRAEFLVAKHLVVEAACGWFSDRSVCYLASGKPVIAQDTGLDGLVPVGTGLLTFTTMDEARAAVDMVARDYERHARAARQIAEEYFDSDRVLTRLLQHAQAS
jgi:hypothetical protein